MKKRKRKPYAGILADETPWAIGRNPIDEEKDVIQGLIVDKLVALLDHYGIPGGLENPENGWKLALMLADDHVPGFAPTHRPPAKPPHRPPNPFVGARHLVLLLEGKVARAEKRSEREAVRELGQRWREQGKIKSSDASLWREYQKVCDQVRKSGLSDGMKEAAHVLGGGT